MVFQPKEDELRQVPMGVGKAPQGLRDGLEKLQSGQVPPLRRFALRVPFQELYRDLVTHRSDARVLGVLLQGAHADPSRAVQVVEALVVIDKGPPRLGKSRIKPD